MSWQHWHKICCSKDIKLKIFSIVRQYILKSHDDYFNKDLDVIFSKSALSMKLFAQVFGYWYHFR